MAKVHRLPDIETTEREASEWIARLNADDVSEDDRARFESWRASHPLHARVYSELAGTWDELQVVASPTGAAASRSSPVTPAAPPRRHFIRAAAASIAGVMVVLAAWYLSRPVPQSLYQTAVGERATIALPDGSTLQLNTNSAAALEYSAQARMVRLERGEAYFEVAHDAQRPFWVVADDSWVRAVGTAFDVHQRGQTVLVTVTDGVVRVGHGDVLDDHGRPRQELEQDRASTLTAGQQGDVGAHKIDVRSLSVEALSRSIGWRSGVLHFDDAPLQEVIDEVSRYTTLRIVAEDPVLRGLRVGGSFEASARGVDAFLTTLSDGLGLRVRREGARVHIESGSDN